MPSSAVLARRVGGGFAGGAGERRAGWTPRYAAAGIDQDQGEPPTFTAMKTACVILLTLAWLVGWTGITLGLAGCLTPSGPAPDPAPALAAVDR